MIRALCATHAERQGDMRSARTANERVDARPPSGLRSVVLAFLFFLVAAYSAFLHRDMALILAAYTMFSMLTYVVYAIDKSSARKGGWRISESTLHLLSLTGGWPGALLAQQVLRHKTRKQSFRLAFWITVIVNCCAFAWLFTPTGTSTLRTLATMVRSALTH